MARFNIDGRDFVGGSITIRNGVVTIDGKRQNGTVSGVVEIRITEGVLQDLETDASVTCGEVRGSITAGGSVSCQNVGGSLTAGGSVNASGRAGGSIMAGGSVRIG